ncbi:biotin--[acetyl-CoA-carboxylase] ligase [Natranaerofaba carboxydovora]|uniref:biotin--[acetyl-CoA-carboxylase] ligase n=1 Tax=Natranaerofaba carboxydovora TaxID=2742683 RepID=UPI001F133DB2|nr:biotin--[acetyl-CoA-carboxylase] ligase [Natranaerofaba carboxydovora]
MLMMLKKKEVISGEELSKEFLISRTAVWKNIQSLQSMGYEIESISGKGYRLTKIPDLLYPWELDLKILDSSKIYYFEKIDSTNRYASRLTPPALVLAERQEVGKGRLSRQWTSNAGGIYCSIVVKPEIDFVKLPVLSLVTSVALVEILRESYNLNAEIKWPNDVMVNNRKLSGILVEASGELDEINKVIIGIGINANQSRDDFPKELKNKITTIKDEKAYKIDRKELTKNLIERVLKRIYDFKENPDSILNLWRKYSCTLGKDVIIKGLKDGDVEGMAVDIDDSGALIVKKDNSEIKVTSGDVSLRLN